MPLKKSKSIKRVKAEDGDAITREGSTDTDAMPRLESSGMQTPMRQSSNSDGDRKADVRRLVENLTELGGETEFRFGRVFLCGQTLSGKSALLLALLGRGHLETESTVGVKEYLVESRNQDVWAEYDPSEKQLERGQARLLAKKVDRTQHVPQEDMSAGNAESSKIVDMLRGKQNITASAAGSQFASQRGNRRGSTLRVDEDLVLKHLDATASDSTPAMQLSVWDMGGSEIFYLIYHLFLTRSGCYVVTFNMQWLTESAFENTKFACINFLRFWLSAIASHTARLQDGRCAPIVLVGTHKDIVTSVDDHERISEALLEEFENHPAFPSVEPYRESRLASGEGSLCFFPVSNKVGREDVVISHLRTTIEKQVTSLDFMDKQVPLQWLAVYDALQKETRNSISLREFEDIAGKCGMPSRPGLPLPEEMFLLSKYLTGLGIMMHNDEETSLRNLVLVNPASLMIQPAARIICDFRVHSVPEHKSAQRAQPHLWTKLKSKGILSRRLFALLCADHDHTNVERLMVKFGLLVPLLPAWAALMDSSASPISGGGKAGDGAAEAAETEAAVVRVEKEQPRANSEQEYLVPAILPELQEGDLLRGSEVRITCYLLFAQPLQFEEWRRAGFATMGQMAKEGFCPSGLFARLVGKCVQWSQCTHGWGVSDMVLGAMGARLCYGSHWFVLRSMPEFQCVRLELLVPQTHLVLGRVVEQAREVLRECMPGVDCEPAVPSDGGRRKGGYTGFQGSMVLVEAMTTADLTKSEMQVDEADRLMVLDAATVRARFDVFLPPKQESEGYHMFLSYRWGPEDTVMAEGLYSRLSLEKLRGQPLQVFRDVYRLQGGRNYRQDFLQAMLSSAVVVPIISKWAIHHMLGMSADSQVDNVLLEWTLCVEILEQGRLAACCPLLLGHWLQAPSPTGAMVSPLFAPPGPVPASLPEVAVRSVNFAAARALKQLGIEPSNALQARTIRSVVTRLTENQGIAAWSLPRPSTGHGRGGLAGDGGWVDRAGSGGSSAHIEQEFKSRLLREAAAKCLLCLQRCVTEAATAAAESEESLTAGSVQSLVEAVRPQVAEEGRGAGAAGFEAQLKSLGRAPAREERGGRGDASQRGASGGEGGGEAGGEEEERRERVWEEKDLDAEWNEIVALKVELQAQVQRAREEADRVAEVRREVEAQRTEMQEQFERTETEIAHVEMLRMMVEVQATKQGLNRVSDPAPALPFRAGTQRGLGSTGVDRRAQTSSFSRTKTSPSGPATGSFRRLDSSGSNFSKLRSPELRPETENGSGSPQQRERKPAPMLQPVALPSLRMRTPSNE